MNDPHVRSSRALIRAESALLHGELCLPKDPRAVVLFAHGSGSGRFSPRNRFVAKCLQRAGLATLLMDLLTQDEDIRDRTTSEFRFNIRMLADRVRACARWLRAQAPTRSIPIGYFGASTGAAAALIAAGESPERIFAVVSRGGRPDLARSALASVEAPTLLIVGENDPEVLKLNREAASLLRAECKIDIVPGASHLFEERGALETVSRLAAGWFVEHLAPAASLGGTLDP